MSVATEMLPFIVPPCDYPCTEEEGFMSAIILIIVIGLGERREERRRERMTRRTM